jgi:L-aminopeptidase/D-esterase-like protein
MPEPTDTPLTGLTSVPGIRVGHWTHPGGRTGCTVVLCPPGTIGGVDVRGPAPGTRETDLLRPGTLVEEVHAVLLSGGSAFGLAAADGVMRYLAERGVGFAAGAARVPIVPAAVLFDLATAEPLYPDTAAGYAAAAAATADRPAEGSVGAGAGATIGKLLGPAGAMKGGIGTAAVRVAGEVVAALVAVNALGDVVDPESGLILAGARRPDGAGFLYTTAALLGQTPFTPPFGHTNIGVVATSAPLDKAQACRLASTAHDGLARSVRPAHTMFDGDTLFTLSTTDGRPRVAAPLLTALGEAAAAVVAQAVVRAVKTKL